MLVSEIIDYIKVSDAKSLGVISLLDKGTDDEKAEATKQLIKYINLGLLDLYKRFNISTEAILIRTNPSVNIYQLRNPNINTILNVYTPSGKELKEQTVEGSEVFDYKRINYETVLIRRPRDEELCFVCNTTLPPIREVTEEVDFPLFLLEPLILYISFRVYGSVGGGGNLHINNTQNMRYENACKKLVEEGYASTIEALSKNVHDKGFV